MHNKRGTRRGKCRRHEMRISTKNLLKQRQVMDRKILKWMANQNDPPPPSGWIKAIRGALGISTRQLAKMMGVTLGSVHTLEARESKGKATLELIQKAAQAMNCKLIYAIVPIEPYPSLDSIVQKKAVKLAEELLKKVDHSMRLELQGSDEKNFEEQIKQLTNELKAKIDPRIWDDIK